MNPLTGGPAERASVTASPPAVGAVVQFLATPLEPELPAPTGAVFQRLRHGHLTGTLDGVLSVSTPPAPGLDVCVRRTAEDLALARDLLARHGLAPGERALDPYRLPAGPTPDTAAVRVRLDSGHDESGPAGGTRRWVAARAVAPVLTAAFANSPLYARRPTGWRCTRQAIRLRALTDHDPRWSAAGYRSGALSGGAPFDAAPFDAARFDAAPSPGLLELDMIDAQPGDGWRVAVAVVSALVDDARAADEAITATEGLPADVWIRAARFGLTDPALADAARHCFVAAYGALARQGVDRDLRDAVAAYLDRYVNRSRSPADDLLRPTTTRT